MDEGGFFAKIVRGELPQAPITKLLGWKLLDFDAEQQAIKVEMQARPEFVNPAGLIHGAFTRHRRIVCHNPGPGGDA